MVTLLCQAMNLSISIWISSDNANSQSIPLTTSFNSPCWCMSTFLLWGHSSNLKKCVIEIVGDYLAIRWESILHTTPSKKRFFIYKISGYTQDSFPHQRSDVTTGSTLCVSLYLTSSGVRTPCHTIWTQIKVPMPLLMLLNLLDSVNITDRFIARPRHL